MSVTPASATPARTSGTIARGSERAPESFGSMLADAGPAADTATGSAPVNPEKAAASEIPSEETVTDDVAPDRMLNLIDPGAWPISPPLPAGGAPLPTGSTADPLNRGPLAASLPSIDATAAFGAAPTEAGKAGSTPAHPNDGTALPLAPAGVTKADNGFGETVPNLGGTGSDTAPPAATTDGQGGDTIEFTLTGLQPLASGTARISPPTLAGPAVTLPAEPDAGFDDSFGTRIGWMADQRIGHAQIRVSPDHVGPIDVRLQLEGNRVNVEFVSTNADVRQTLEASVVRLRELLDQQGLQLTHANVGSGQSGTSGKHTPAHAAGASGSNDSPYDAADVPEPTVMRRGLVDEYA
ncbi:MAG: flagellar hook-length control protein FliK [Lysobacter sp.]